jgi:glycosyltransferase involved in cell wall biosynthesis
MRVLHVTAGMAVERGGPPPGVAAVVAALGRAGVDAEIFSAERDGYSGSMVPSPGFEPRTFQTGILTRLWPGYSRDYARALSAEISRFDVVHIHEPWHHPHHHAAKASRRAGVPYVISPHGAFSPVALKKGELKKKAFLRLHQRRHLMGAAVIHAMTDTEAVDVTRIAPAASLRVIPWGVDSAEFALLPEIETFYHYCPEARGKSIALFLGRLNPVKGLDVLLRGFGSYAESARDVLLVIAGPDAGFELSARAIVRELKIEDRVSFLGQIDGEARLAALGAADIFVLPSYGEGFSVAILEALAAGVPALISHECNFPDVETEGAGIVISPTETGVHEGFARLFSDQSKLAEMSRCARDLATDRYSWNSVATSFIDLYGEVVGDGSS